MILPCGSDAPLSCFFFHQLPLPPPLPLHVPILLNFSPPKTKTLNYLKSSIDLSFPSSSTPHSTPSYLQPSFLKDHSTLLFICLSFHNPKQSGFHFLHSIKTLLRWYPMTFRMLSPRTFTPYFTWLGFSSLLLKNSQSLNILTSLSFSDNSLFPPHVSIHFSLLSGFLWTLSNYHSTVVSWPLFAGHLTYFCIRSHKRAVHVQAHFCY